MAYTAILVEIVLLLKAYPATASSPSNTEEITRADHIGPQLYVSPICALGTFLSVVGTGIRASCYRHMGRQFTFQFTLDREHKLVTSGPYSVVRHPGYTGLYLFFAGSVMSFFGPGSLWEVAQYWTSLAGKLFAAWFILYRTYTAAVLFARISKEDAVMRREFRGQWESWARQTPYRLVPFMY